MKKMKLFVLLGLLVSSFPLISNGSFESASAEEGEDPIQLEFKGIEAHNYDCVGYECTNYLPADIVENFKAPNGSVFKLFTTYEKLKPIGEYINALPEFSSGHVKYADFEARRTIEGMSLFSDLELAYDMSIDGLLEFIRSSAESIVLYEIEEKTTTFDVDSSFKITVYGDEDESLGYEFTFSSPTYHVKPYEDGDFINLRISSYNRFTENRINVYPEVNMDIFNEEYGFKTDGRTPKESWQGPGYNEDYSVVLFDKNTNVILGVGDDSIEMTPVPTRPVTIYARLSFEADGEKYVYNSNEVIAEEMMPGALLDGFDNRDTIGLDDNKTHQLTLLTTVNREKVTRFSISLFYINSNDEYISIGDHLYDPKTPDQNELYQTLDDDFFTFDLSFDKPGEYQIFANIIIFGENLSYHSENRWNKKINVVEGKVEHISDVNKALTIDTRVDGKSFEQNINDKGEINIFCIAGGKSIDVIPNIPNDLLNNGEVPTFNINEDELPSVIKVKKEEEGRKITVIPSNEGTATLVVSSLIKGFGLVEKKINFKVVNDISSISYLEVPNEFHYSKKPLTVKMAFKSTETIANLAVEWKVTDANDAEVEFVDNGDLSITLNEPLQSNYKIVATLNGFEICSTIVEVRDVNVDQYVRNNIWWLFLISLALVGLAISAKLLLNKKSTIVDQIRNINEKLEDIDLSNSDWEKHLGKVKILLQTAINYTNDLNIDGMNQYEKTIRYLNKTLDGIKRIESHKTEDKTSILEQAKKDLSKALLVVTDIQNAKTIMEKNSLKANTNNYAKLENEKDSKKKK